MNLVHIKPEGTPAVRQPQDDGMLCIERWSERVRCAEIGHVIEPIFAIVPVTPGRGWLRVVVQEPRLVAGRRYRIERTGECSLDGREVDVPMPFELPVLGLCWLLSEFTIPG